MASIKDVVIDLLAVLKGINTLEYVSIWNNQHHTIGNGKSEVFTMPAAFIEIVTPETLQSIGVGCVAGDLNIKIHLLHNQLDAGDGTMGQNLDVFDIKDSIVVALSGYKPIACGTLQRISESQNYDHDNIYEYIIEFNTHFIDSKGSPHNKDSGKFINTTPPTDLQINVTDVNSLN